jgi:endonuclease/exonuclease/phosphatase family metal-dependent hydrolase
MVHLFNLHLGLNWRERGEQLKKLADLAKNSMHVPEDVSYANAVTIFAGDFNEWIPFRLQRWADEASKKVKAKGRGRKRTGELERLAGYCERSFPTLFPLLSFDGIFSTAAVSMRVHRSEAARQASDHLPIIAEIAV